MLHVGLGFIGIGFGIGVGIVGAAFGIARCAAAALEGASRQPEAAGALQTMMIIPAAMIEGIGLLALIISLLAVLSLNKGVVVGPSAAPAAATQSR